MKKACLFLVVCLMGTISMADVLLNDTFADGDCTNTNLPTESAFWAGHPDMITMGTGSLAYGTLGTASEKMWTYFAADGAPASLSVGEQLIATIKFSATGLYNTTTSKNFRFGLFTDPTDSQIHSNVNDDGGGTGDLGQADPWTDSTGYAIQMTLSSGTTAGGIQVGKRTNQTSGSLLGTSGDYAWGTTGSKATNLTEGTLYTMQMVLDYQSASEMLVTFTFSDAGGVIASADLLDNGLGGDPVWTDFDQLFFRPSKAEGVANTITFSEFKIEHVVPEPATMILLGLGGLVTLRRRK